MKYAFFSLFLLAATAWSVPAATQTSAGEERATAFVAGADATGESLDPAQKNLIFAAAAVFSVMIFGAFFAARRTSDRSRRNLESIADDLRAKGADDV